MNLQKTDINLSQTEILNLLSQTQNYEYSRQVVEGINCLKPFWSHHTVKPDISSFSLPVQGEVLLRCGALLSYLCHMEQLKHQDLAREWFSESASIFARIGDSKDKIAEVETEMAMTYWREGRQFEKALFWLDSAASKNTNDLNSVSIRNISYTILVLASMDTPESFQRGAALVKDKDIYARLCGDSRVKAHYYNNTAILMTRLGQMSDALERHYQTIHYCNEIGNRIGAAIAENNIGWVYKELKESDKALIHTNNGLKIFSELNDITRLAGTWDTKAQIHLQLNELDEATACIEQSLEILKRGDDYKTLSDSLNTKIQILSRSNQTAQALMVFCDAYELTKKHLGEAAAEGCARDFSKLIHIRTGDNFSAQIEQFEKFLIEIALIASDGLLNQTAASLELPEETLTDMLALRHKDLLKKFNLKTAASSRRGKLLPNKEERNGAALLPPPSPAKRKKISLKEFDCNGFPVFIAESVDVGFFMQYSEPRLASLGLLEGRVAVVSSGLSVPNKYPTVLRSFLNSSIYYYGFRVDVCGLIGLEADEGEPLAFSPEDVEVVGKIIGYCEFDFDKKIYKYHPLDI